MRDLAVGIGDSDREKCRPSCSILFKNALTPFSQSRPKLQAYDVTEQARARGVIMRALFFAVLILCGSCQSQSVSSGSTRQASQQKLPLSKGSFRPKLSLQDALKLAEEYVHETHIAISDYWLCEARFITFGDQTKSDQQPAWFFWWQKENGGMGDYVELVVFMNGKIRRMPSM